MEIIMKKLIVILILLVTPLFAQKQKENFKKVFTQNEKMMFLDSVNKYRIKKGIHPVSYFPDAERLSNLRIKTVHKHVKEVFKQKTIEEFFEDKLEHLHYNIVWDFHSFKFHLKEQKKDYMFNPAECIALFFQKEDNMVEALFNGWKGSPSHWNGMMDESYDNIALEMKETDQGLIGCLILFEKFNN